MEDLEAYPFKHKGEVCDTLYKMIQKNKDEMPDNDALGTRDGDEFKWTSWAQLDQITQNLATSLLEKNLCP